MQVRCCESLISTPYNGSDEQSYSTKMISIECNDHATPSFVSTHNTAHTKLIVISFLHWTYTSLLES